MGGYSALTNGPGSIDDRRYPQNATFMTHLSPASCRLANSLSGAQFFARTPRRPSRSILKTCRTLAELFCTNVLSLTLVCWKQIDELNTTGELPTTIELSSSGELNTIEDWNTYGVRSAK